MSSDLVLLRVDLLRSDYAFLMLLRFLLLVGLWLPLAAEAAPRGPEGGRPREILTAALNYADARWDEATGLLWSPAPGEQGRFHRTRESSWYALGLLMRGAPGDDGRAARILSRVAASQFDAPGQPWDGTFQRSPEEPPPQPGAKLWRDFDPNWRQFIGCTFALVLEEFSPRLPAELRTRLLDSIHRAVRGELTEGRDEPYHTNIKLMHGFLWSWAGVRLKRTEWIAGGENVAADVAAAFSRHETFDEYNSPTYYGVDLYGLGLWRRYGATEKIRALGAQLEAGLWRDIGRFYHAGLRNLCGPYDRAYGMDQRRYVSLVGVWMGLALPAELTPLPDPSHPMDHAHDFLAAPAYVLLGARIPADVLAGLREFQGERLLRRPIEGARVATAWLAPQVMIGGELTGATRAAGPATPYNQFHPATIHWRAPGGEVGWVRLQTAPAGDAKAGRGTLTITAPGAGDFTFHLHAPGLSRGLVARERWTLPGLSVEITSDAADFAVSAEEDFLIVSYRGAKTIEMRTRTSAP